MCTKISLDKRRWPSGRRSLKLLLTSSVELPPPFGYSLLAKRESFVLFFNSLHKLLLLDKRRWPSGRRSLKLLLTSSAELPPPFGYSLLAKRESVFFEDGGIQNFYLCIQSNSLALRALPLQEGELFFQLNSSSKLARGNISSLPPRVALYIFTPWRSHTSLARAKARRLVSTSGGA